MPTREQIPIVAHTMAPSAIPSNVATTTGRIEKKEDIESHVEPSVEFMFTSLVASFEEKMVWLEPFLQQRTRFQDKCTEAFRDLPADLLSLMCTYLSSISLVHMRLVSKHWAHVSRLPRSWKSSYWKVPNPSRKETKNLMGNIRAMPYLRGVSLEAAKLQSGEIVEVVNSLPLLEDLCFDEPPVHSFREVFFFEALRTNCPKLREFRLCKGGGAAQFLKPENCGQLKLATFNTDGCISSICAVANTPMSRSLRAGYFANCSGSAPEPWPAGLESFTSLRIMILKFGWQQPFDLRNILSPISMIPNLRVLGVQCINSAWGVESLLQNPTFNAQLEYLRLKGCIITPETLRLIAEQCTNLIGLELCRTMELRHVPVTQILLPYEPVRTQIWDRYRDDMPLESFTILRRDSYLRQFIEWEKLHSFSSDGFSQWVTSFPGVDTDLSHLSFEELRLSGGEIKQPNRSVLTVDGDIGAAQIHLFDILTLPDKFRMQLRYLRLDSGLESCIPQIRARFPHLLDIQFDHIREPRWIFPLDSATIIPIPRDPNVFIPTQFSDFHSSEYERRTSLWQWVITLKYYLGRPIDPFDSIHHCTE